MGNLKFEYQPRSSDIVQQVANGSMSPYELGAILEKRDQELEVFLSKPSAGANPGALIDVSISSSGGAAPGGVVCSTSVTVPNDGGSYYLESIGTLFALVGNYGDGTTAEYVHDIEPRIVATLGSGWAASEARNEPAFDWTTTAPAGLTSELGIPSTVMKASTTPVDGVQGFDLFWGYNASFSTPVGDVSGVLITKLFSLPV